MRILIADDSKPITDRLTEMLNDLPGIDVAGCARTAGECLQFIRITKPDVLLLDLEMCGSNGLDVLRSIQPGRGEITTIVLTNSASAPFREACRKAGAAYFLDKSNELGDLEKILTQLIAHRHGGATTLPRKKAG